MRVFCKVGDADKNGGHKGKVDGDLRQDIAYQFKHGCAIAARLQTGKPLGIAGKWADQCGGKRGGNPPGQRVRGANQIRREECGQRGYSHCDGIKKTARDAQRLTNEAIMNENSPICARLIPMRIDVRPSCPAVKAPRPQERIFPNTTTGIMIAIGPAYSTRTCQASISPIAMKKIALNISRSETISRSIACRARDSAIMAPIRKAPSAML